MRKSNPLLLAVSFIFLISCLGGCGYTTRSMITNQFRTIYIKPFVNKIDFTQENQVSYRYRIYRPQLETEITKAVVDKYIFDGNLKPSEKDVSDLSLIGELVEFRKDPLRYTDNDDVEEFRVNIVVNITLWDNKENKLVWQVDKFLGYFDYYTMGAQMISEDAAVRNALKDLARRIVERTVEQW